MTVGHPPPPPFVFRRGGVLSMQAKASRDRQSEVIVRLQEMDESSRQRAQAVARELAKLREEGRLARERASKAKV